MSRLAATRVVESLTQKPLPEVFGYPSPQPQRPNPELTMPSPVDSHSASDLLRLLELRVDKYVDDSRYASVITATNGHEE